MTDSYSFPVEPRRSKNQIEHDFGLLKSRNAKDPSLHFRIAATKKWQMVDVPAQSLNPEMPLVSLGLFRRMNEPPAEAEVIAALLPREIDPANWLAIYLKNHGFKLLQMRRLPSPTGEVGDVLAEVEVDSKTYVARSLAIKDGARVFAVVCQVESDGYEQVAEEFLMAVSKFNLLNPSRQRYAEPMKVEEISAPVSCQFLFPESWLKKEDSTPPPGGASFSFINVRQDKWAGQFTFAAVRHTDEENYQGLLANYLEQLDENDIEVEAGDLTAANAPDFMGMWSGTLRAVNDDEEPLEIRCVILKHQQAWFLFAMIGPAWEQDAEAQSINYRAFRLSLETFSAASNT